MVTDLFVELICLKICVGCECGEGWGCTYAQEITTFGSWSEK